MTDVVWSVNILLGIGLLGTAWAIYKILLTANQENVSVQNKKDQQSD
jgi:mannose/fructose/N-acetylgalactosamine-specific phosphotransferase system component IIC